MLANGRIPVFGPPNSTLTRLRRNGFSFSEVDWLILTMIN